jgi:hypothetical protein
MRKIVWDLSQAQKGNSFYDDVMQVLYIKKFFDVYFLPGPSRTFPGSSPVCLS